VKDTLITVIIICVVLFCGFENGRTPKTFFLANCKLTVNIIVPPAFNRRTTSRHERMHTPYLNLRCMKIDVVELDLIDHLDL
jgi:hypothetical protein